jgi:peptidoglycan hydrolase-like protein with peptidoglycan-binding domain
MKLRTALLAGIGLVGGACLLPLAPASAQTGAAPGTAGATSGAPGATNSGAVQGPASTGTMGSGTVGTPGSTSGAPMGSSMAPSAPSGSATMGSNTNMGSDVSKLQQALNDNGESVKVDGVMGPETENALKDYQQKNGLQASGQLDSQTRQKLNLGS